MIAWDSTVEAHILPVDKVHIPLVAPFQFKNPKWLAGFVYQAEDPTKQRPLFRQNASGLQDRSW